jgi:hypothetical protein
MVVVVFVGYPLFVREAEPAEDVLEAAIAQRRGKKRSATTQASSVAASRSRGVVTCAQCGASNLQDDRFCARCGAGLGQQRCTACGTAYDEGDVFCAKCGERLAGRPQ